MGVAAALLAVLAGGCGGGSSRRAARPATSDPGPASASTTTVAPTTTSTVPPTASIPAVITIQYVDAVLAQLNHVYGDVSREDLATKNVPRSSLAALRAIFADPLYQQEVQIAIDSLLQDLSNVRNPPGDRVTHVTELLSAAHECIFARTTTDYSGVLVQPTPPAAAEYYELVPKPPANDPQSLNPTAWSIKGNVAFPNPPSTSPVDPCSAE